MSRIRSAADKSAKLAIYYFYLKPMEKSRASKEKKLDKIFNPKTIAVIGASDREGSVGNALMKNLLENKYDGVVYPINPGRETVHGLKAYQKIGDVPVKVDIAIVVTPAATVPDIVEECGRAGVSGLVIISAGFDEVGVGG